MTLKNGVWWLIGDSIWMRHCTAQNKLSVHGNVTYFLDWIYHQMRVKDVRLLYKQVIRSILMRDVMTLIRLDGCTDTRQLLAISFDYVVDVEALMFVCFCLQTHQDD